MQLTINQAALLLGVSEAQVHRWIRDRGMPAILFNEQYRLNRVSLMDWAQRNQIPLPDPAFDEARVALEANVARLNEIVFGPQDYALVGRT